MVNRNFIRKELDLIGRYGQGSWALVTGCTAGIGEQFVHSLASRGFNIVLVSRSPSKLSKVEADLNKRFRGIKIKVIAMDLGEATTPEKIEQISTETKDLDISLVINNAGIINFDKFATESLDVINNMINLNALTPTLIMSSFIPRLNARKLRGGIINVDSCAGSVPFPTMANYSGSKAYLRSLTLGISEEEKEKIDVMVLAPGSCNTQMSGYLKTNMHDPMTSTPEQTVENTLKALGQTCLTHGYIFHDFFAWLLTSLYSISPSFFLWSLSTVFPPIAAKVNSLREKKSK
jgi:short-subunit dehydrogenase